MTFNVSDPSNPTYVAYIDDSDADYDKLGNPNKLLVHQSGEKWYLAVSSFSVQTTAYGGNGVQIVDVSDPYNPSAAASMVDGTDGFTCLDGPHSVDILDIAGTPYLFVAADEDCIQIADFSDPTDPVAVSTYGDMEGTYSYMDFPLTVKGVEVAGRYYALVNARSDNTVVVVDVTDPSNPVEASSMAYASAKSSTGISFPGIGSSTAGGGIAIFKATSTFGRTSTFMVTVGYTSVGTMQLADISDPSNPIAVADIAGSTSSTSEFYMMRYYTRCLTVVESNGIFYALIAMDYNSNSISYPNGLQVVKINPSKTW